MKANTNKEENMDEEEDDDNCCSILGMIFLSIVLIVGTVYALARYTDVSDEIGTYLLIVGLTILVLVLIIIIVTVSFRHNRNTFADTSAEHRSHEIHRKIN